MIGLIVSCKGNSDKTEKIIDLQKSKAGQIYQWTEDEGKEFLSHTRQSITKSEAWNTRANEIRTHILKVTGLDPFLAKHLNLDLSRAVNPDGSLNEEGIVIEEIEDLYKFDENHPYPDNAIRNNNDIVWD